MTTSTPYDAYASAQAGKHALRIHDLEHDCLVLAMALLDKLEQELPAETVRVMRKWRRAAEEELGIAEPPICADCNGSGEGMHDGTRCLSCKGWGIEREREA